MADSQAIHQIEYRWQQARDMSAVASSLPSASRQSWVQRIGTWVRHPGVQAPTDSVRYARFGNTSAALAWRLRDRQAVGPEDGRPLASRVLVGPADLLNPEVAITVCYAGLPLDLIGPPPGSVAPGDFLPAVDANWLNKLVQDKTEALDQAAARETGLDRLAAAALSDVVTPLAVELPERLIVRTPRGGSQAVLLWGLWTTVSPLLGDGARRDWSFSTFELPMSDMDPATLPDIVFRVSRPAPSTAPLTTRTEIRVRPQEPVVAPVETLPQHLARSLVIAYQDLGGEEFTRMLASYAGDHKSTEQRMRAVYSALEAKRSPAPGPESARASEAARLASPSAVAPSDSPQAVAPSDSAQARTAPSEPSGPEPQAPVPATQVTRPTPIPPAVSPPAVRPSLFPAGSLRDAPQSRPDGNRPRPGEETGKPATLSVLFARLSAGPATEGFESALRALRARNFQGDQPERAAARKLMARHRWYVDAVRPYDQAEHEAILMMIFLCSVIPDLTDRQVQAEITSWVGEQAAPEPVINALYQATDAMVGTQPLLSQALEPALAKRWRDEHGIHVPVAIPAPAQVPGPDGGAGRAGPGGRDAGASPRDQGAGSQRAAVPQESPPSAVPVASEQPAASSPQAAGPQASARPSNEMQALLTLLESRWNVPAPLVLALCVIVIVLFLTR